MAGFRFEVQRAYVSYMYVTIMYVVAGALPFL